MLRKVATFYFKISEISLDKTKNRKNIFFSHNFIADLEQLTWEIAAKKYQF